MNRNLPNLSCDCHTHVFGPKGQYPYALARQYTPEDASIEALLALGTSIGTQRVVIVQPSPYGADNRCTVDALIRINTQNQAADHGVQGDKARGVAVIDEATTDKSLQAMHAAGVRGIRLNLETSGVSDPAYAEQLFRWSAGRVAHLDWHLQMYTTLPVLASLAPAIRDTGVPVVVDHFCRANAKLGVSQAHLDTLLGLVQQGFVWVKLSAAQRISELPDCEDVKPIAQALIAANPDRMLWGSDWPHPGAKPGQIRRPEVIESFNDVDDKRAIERIVLWTGDDVTRQKIFVSNPERLYDF